jgi:hypothetical protein
MRVSETPNVRQESLQRQAAEMLSRDSNFRGRNMHLHIECRGDVLVVHGRVATFYLKQLLQTRLQELEGVHRIDNRVDVVNSAGLSSA